MSRLWPKSLVGQLALLVAAALFVAQAVNFALLLQGNRSLRQAQLTGPVLARIGNAVDRDRAGDRPFRGRALRVETASPLRPGDRRLADVEALVARAFADSGRNVLAVRAAVREFERGALARPRDRRERRIMRSGAELLVAVQVAPARWVVLSQPWNQLDRRMISRLIAQTIVIYLLVLVPVVWIGRRIARPLGELSAAARAFSPAAPGAPVGEHGPRDVRELIAAFNALRLRVVAMLDEKDRMLGAIGHDLRTPLAALRVRIESVEDDADRARMATGIDDINRMLDDILSLARVGRGGEPPTATDLAALVDAVVEDFRDLGAAIDYEPSARVIAAVRPAAMQRAVRNLIENAVKYAGAAEIVVEPGRIAVRDRGPGIPPDRLAEVFEPFTRVESSRNRDTGGSGLGLTLARAIVTEAGGTLTLANRAGGGLEAVIALPR